MIKRVFIILSCVLLLSSFSLFVFADSIDQTEQYAFIARTPVTASNWTQNSFPVTDCTTAIRRVDYGKLYFALYSAGWEQGGGTPALTSLSITTDTVAPDNVPVQYIKPTDYNSGWIPTMWEDNPYWSIAGANGYNVATFNPVGYTGNTNFVYSYKCYSSATQNMLNFETGIIIKSVDLAYHSPVWDSQAHDTVTYAPFSANGNDPVYFDYMKMLGYYRMTLNCTNPNFDQFSVIVEYPAYAGEYDITTSSILYTGNNASVNSGAHYDAGYQAGVQDGINSVRPQINEAYENGYIAGVNAGGDGYGFFTSALLSIGEIPFNMMLQIADLEILGFNFASLVTMAMMGLVLTWCIRKLFL